MTFQSAGLVESEGRPYEKQMNSIDKQRLAEKLSYAEQDLD